MKLITQQVKSITQKETMRPWELNDPIPAPLMVRRKLTAQDLWTYAHPVAVRNEVLIFSVLQPDGCSTINANTLFKDFVQLDGKPCGTAIKDN